LSQQTVSSSMKVIRVGKTVLNIGVGKSGEAVERAKRVLEQISGQKPEPRKAKKSIRDFGVHKGEPIGVLVTLRGKETEPLIKRLLEARSNKLVESCFDDRGSVSFGLKEHIEIPGIKYDPEIGIFGLNASVLLERPGYRVARRMRRTSKVGKEQLISKQEAMEFFKSHFGVTID
jgi:large subunit ribosomal protein L5